MYRLKERKYAMITLLIMLTSVVSLILPNFNAEAVQTTVDHIIISELYYDTYVSYEPEEYIAITNPTNSSVDVSNWGLSNGSATITFPANTVITSNETFYVAREAATFIQQKVVDVTPRFEYGADTVSSVPQMLGSTSLQFANGGDEVFLVDASGKTIDAIVYGSSTFVGEGWTGAAVPVASEGDIIVREQHETTGVWEDTDSVLDFNGLRVYQAGQSRFGIEGYTFTGSVETYTAPDTTYQVLTNFINSAQYTLDINLYQFHSPHILDTVLKAINRGVKVRAFFEGSPVGGYSEEAKYVSQKIVEAGGEVRYIILNRDEDRHKRYSWNHAKYGIVDGKKTFVQSENWKNSGVPVDNSIGNRGWGIIIDNAGVADYFQMVFNMDWNEVYRDSFPYTPGHATYGEPSSSFVVDTVIPTGTYPAPFASKMISGTFTVYPVMAPDTTFNQTTSIIGLIRSAQTELYVDQMYAHKHWGDQTGTPETDPNYYLEEVIDAARRGVKVRMTLGDSWLDPTNSRDNSHTIEYVNGIAQAEGLDMVAKLKNSELIGISALHNKGVIADDKVLISSINWSENSPTNNREAGVIIQNAEVANFYKEVFLYDYNDGVIEEPTPVINVVEGFEVGSKTSYTAGDVELSTGSWNFDNALLGSLSSDRKNGTRSARIKSLGSISMNFDVEAATTVKVSHANFSSDTGANWKLQKSTDGGLTWVDVDTTITSTSTLTERTFTVNEARPVRFRIAVSGTSGHRINIDDFTILN